MYFMYGLMSIISMIYISELASYFRYFFTNIMRSNLPSVNMACLYFKYVECIKMVKLTPLSVKLKKKIIADQHLYLFKS